MVAVIYAPLTFSATTFNGAQFGNASLYVRDLNINVIELIV